MKIKISITIVICLILLSGCGKPPAQTPSPTPTLQPTNTPSPSKTPIPTSTATATFTATPTATFTSTPTSTPTETVQPTMTETPTPSCQASNGNWRSKESTTMFTMRYPLLTFTVSKCVITSWEISAYPLPGELLWWEGTSTIPIIEDQFTDDEDMEGSTFTFAGSFDSEKSSHGTLNFPKGFSVFGTILTEDVSIPWTATPGN